jgi:polar amino acid transport system substrate-binding protein
MDFSPPHAIVNHAIFARRGTPTVSSLSDLRGHKVTLHGRGFIDDKLTALGYGEDLDRTETPADAMRRLASGEDEYAVVAVVPGAYLIRELRLSNLVPVARAVSTGKYCYAVRKGSVALLARLTEGLAILKQTGRYDAIHHKWLGVLEPAGPSLETVTKYVAAVVLPLLVILGGTVLWSRSLKSEVAQRTTSLAREVAERERVVEELRVNQQQLVQADKMAALGILVSGVAHEINNPNGFILLNMPTLKESFLDAKEVLDERLEREGDFPLGGLPYSRMRAEVPRMLDEMEEGARRIKRIVEDLKDFARSEPVAHFEPVDINRVVRAAIRLVDASIKKSTSRFEARYGDLPLVRGNAQRIEQVVVNLVLNACQAIPDPSRGVFVTTSHDVHRSFVVLTVRDEGEGIATEHLRRLTDPFFTTKRETGGTGLGLSVSDGIAKEHGGALEFRSRPGEGTTATLTLPLGEGAAA